MKVLIVSATEFESIKIRDSVTNTDFQCAHTIDFLYTGVGMVATTYSLMKYLKTSEAHLILNIGLAGSFTEEFGIGNVVEVEQEIFGDLGAEDDADFLDLVDLKLLDENNFPFTKNKISNRHTFKINLPKTIAISVNKVHGNVGSIKKIVDKYHPQIESMEGAAVFYVCKMENIPCVQIRSISNFVEKRDKSKWNIPLALETLSNSVIKILKEN